MGTLLKISMAQAVTVYDAIRWAFTEREVKTMVILQTKSKGSLFAQELMIRSGRQWLLQKAVLLFCNLTDIIQPNFKYPAYVLEQGAQVPRSGSRGWLRGALRLFKRHKGFVCLTFGTGKQNQKKCNALKHRKINHVNRRPNRDQISLPLEIVTSPC